MGGGGVRGKCSVFSRLLVRTARGRLHLQCDSNPLVRLDLHQAVPEVSEMWSFARYLGAAFGLCYVPPGELFGGGAAACAALVFLCKWDWCKPVGNSCQLHSAGRAALAGNCSSSLLWY